MIEIIVWCLCVIIVILMLIWVQLLSLGVEAHKANLYIKDIHNGN